MNRIEYQPKKIVTATERARILLNHARKTHVSVASLIPAADVWKRKAKSSNPKQ